MPSPLSVLKQKFGYDNFRDQQEAIINKVLSQKDVMVLMPTGGGKSLCYQIPALLFEGLTLVISPLIALMKDQVDALKVNGIPAAYINSSQTAREQSEVYNKLKNNELKMLYMAPERLWSQGFIDFIKTLNVSMIAIDEAHCISQWGHDFRPEYLKLAELKHHFPETPVIGLTATADQLTRKDILEKLNLKDPVVFISSFNRKNIHYHVTAKRQSYNKLVDFLHHHQNESGIIYTLSRASTEDLADRLTEDGFSARPYHAGLNTSVKAQHQEQFLKDEVKIIVATIAFGMGIDKSNVRFVVHMDLPKNIEGYYQETGRAGRDGLHSEALLFYSYADVMKLQGFVEVDNNDAQSRIMLKKLHEMAEYGGLRSCRRKFLLNYFGEDAPDQCGSCDVCLTENETFDGTVIAQKALSAVVRLGQSFGTSYVVDFLRGSKAEKIRGKHKQLKTYGVGADISKADWLRYMKDLLHLGYLKKTTDQYPVLKLTEKSQGVLKGNMKVMLIESSSTEKAAIPEDPLPADKVLFDTLRNLRNQLATQENVPAYIIFSDATLNEMATYYPLELKDLEHISGFGSVKIDKYGFAFLEEIKRHCKAVGLVSKMNEKPRTQRKKSVKKRTNNTKKESLQMYRSGKTIKEIATLRGLATSTIEHHLAHFILDGTLSVNDFVDKNKINTIRDAITKHGENEGLKPVKESLGDTYSYGEIRAVQSHIIYLQAEQNNI